MPVAATDLTGATEVRRVAEPPGEPRPEPAHREARSPSRKATSPDHGIVSVTVCTRPSLALRTVSLRILSGAALVMIQLRCPSASVT